MLKHCRNLPRAGVGFVGLALVLMFSVAAQASTLRRSGTQTEGAMLFGVPAGADPAAHQGAVGPLPSVQQFSLTGSTSVNFLADSSVCITAGLICNAGETCQCLSATGSVTDGLGPLYHGSANLVMNIVTSFPTRQYPNGNNAGKVCFFATGVLGVTVSMGSTLNFITSGAACNAISGGFALYSGGTVVGPSTGGFVNAVAAGLLGFGTNFNTGVGIFEIQGGGTNLN